MAIEQAGNRRRQAGRRRPRRAAGVARPSDWRAWLISAVARAGAAVGFLLVPTVRVQLGDAALVAVCFGVAACLAAAAAIHVYLTEAPARRDLAADAVAVLVLGPSAVVAASVQSADDRFGGRTENVLAALAATTMVFAIVAIVARADPRIGFGESTLGALAGALAMASVIGNPDRFNAADAWQGLSIAWMVAAVTSAGFAIMPGAVRALVAPVVYALFAVVIYQLPSDRPAQAIESGSLPLLAIIAIGAVMVLVAATGPRDPSR